MTSDTAADIFRLKLKNVPAITKRPNVVGIEVPNWTGPVLVLKPWSTCGISETVRTTVVAVMVMSCQSIIFG